MENKKKWKNSATGIFKNYRFLNAKSFLFLLFLFLFCSATYAQKTVKGQVTDETGEPVIGASIAEKGTTRGTVTDFDGNFQLTVAENAVLVISYIGYATQEVPVTDASTLRIILKEDAQLLDELVVIGYGSMKKGDLTGSVELLTVKDMNKGPIVTADNLITGRMPGVQVIPNGNPGTGSQIRIRGGASLDASNDPLIVVDGLPLENGSISQINPNDIETFSVLKDASATAIYGSRASNGVILITTKKGGEGKWKFNLDAQGTVMTLPWTVKSLSQPEFIEAVTNFQESSAGMLGYNGTMYNTDWQKEIFQTAVGTANNLSATGKIGSFLPARVSVGYNNTPGLLITSGYQRANANIALTPSFFNNTLKIEFNANGSYEKYNKADEGAIGGAIFFDPTKPVYVNGSRDENAKYLGYYEWGADYGNNNNYPYNNLSGRNPVSLLKEVDHTSDVWKLWGNVQLDYAFPFVKGLNAVVNLGLQTEKWFEDYYANKTANTMFTDASKVSKPVGSEWHNKGNSTNRLLDAYLKYNNTFAFIKMDLMGGYSYQKMNVGTEYNSRDVLKHALDNTIELPLNKIYTPKVLISFFGRANLSLADKYLLTLTVRNDHSSMFSEKNRSGIFPAASFAWRAVEEKFMQNQNIFSNLKLRLGWGITGQQNLYGDERININRYLPLYAFGTNTYSQYPIGNVNAYPVYPQAYNPNLKWEETTTYNAGLDFGFVNNRVYGSIDVYYKESTDLLANVMLPAGVNFANQMYMNSGAFSTKGVELGLGWDVIRNEQKGAFNWSLAYNISLNKLEIIDYSKDSSNERIYVAGGGGGIPIAMFELGRAPYTYNVYKQVYDAQGNAIEGVFEDLNKNGRLDDGDKYLFHSPNPVATMGLASNFSYENFDFSMAWRASIGNYIYNAIGSMNSYRLQLDPSGSYLHNIISDKYQSPDDTKRVSDEWIENGSFLKWDNATLGYNFNQIIKGIDMRAYFSVQNILTITKANVKDPEVAVGGDNAGVVQNLYPRPRTFLLGLNFNF
ncbi:MAG: SusC/RagA family TonB-linked outer membrane protein [Dysgonamonadaceae bacterium]|jgi:iron complex outermembrane receptor protein|nr:SusC/RagA family TonB-linked outer membrane protein [Dysgonamonadaceae bacterium]